jgi:hypothetical protein
MWQALCQYTWALLNSRIFNSRANAEENTNVADSARDLAEERSVEEERNSGEDIVENIKTGLDQCYAITANQGEILDRLETADAQQRTRLEQLETAATQLVTADAQISAKIGQLQVVNTQQDARVKQIATKVSKPETVSAQPRIQGSIITKQSAVSEGVADAWQQLRVLQETLEARGEGNTPESMACLAVLRQSPIGNRMPSPQYTGESVHNTISDVGLSQVEPVMASGREQVAAEHIERSQQQSSGPLYDK